MGMIERIEAARPIQQERGRRKEPVAETPKAETGKTFKQILERKLKKGDTKTC
jgi:hypothetical protein